MQRWTTSGGSTGYAEHVYPNRKVGHVVGVPICIQGKTNHKFKEWLGNLDGISCGSAPTKDEAQELVDVKYKERYGR